MNELVKSHLFQEVNKVKVKDGDKTKEQLINELIELHQRVAELGKLENQCRQADIYRPGSSG